jgi:hypothetical protein
MFTETADAVLQTQLLLLAFAMRKTSIPLIDLPYLMNDKKRITNPN